MAQNAELLELLKKGIGLLEYLAEKAACAEMRQCHARQPARPPTRLA